MNAEDIDSNPLDQAVDPGLDMFGSDTSLDFEEVWRETARDISHEGRWYNRLRNRSTSQRRAIALGGLLALAALVFVAAKRADLGVVPLEYLLPTVGTAMLCIALAVLGTVRSAAKIGWAPSQRWLLLGAAVAVATLPALLPEAHHAHPASLGGVGDELVKRALGCFLWGTTLAGVTLILLSQVVQGSRLRATFSPVEVAAAAGLSALALTLHCPLVNAEHLWLGHVSVAGVLGLLAVGFRAWFSRLRHTA
jgi:hypothetical protein